MGVGVTKCFGQPYTAPPTSLAITPGYTAVEEAELVIETCRARHVVWKGPISKEQLFLDPYQKRKKQKNKKQKTKQTQNTLTYSMGQLGPYISVDSRDVTNSTFSMVVFIGLYLEKQVCCGWWVHSDLRKYYLAMTF